MKGDGHMCCTKNLCLLLICAWLGCTAVGCAAEDTNRCTPETSDGTSESVSMLDFFTAEELRKVEELQAMSYDEVLELFVQNGLELHTDMTAGLSDAEIKSIFNTNFDLLCAGVPSYGSLMIYTLAEDMECVFHRLIASKNIED